MNDHTRWITLISVTCAAISVILGVITYVRQQKINRIQNLVAVFQRFANNDDFLSIFSISDMIYVKLGGLATDIDLPAYIASLSSIPPEKKYKYLALLEEIAILAKNSAVINKNAIHLFKFHFYYVYGSHQLSHAFWQNIGSGDSEKNKEGWSYQYDFAKECESNIKK